MLFFVSLIAVASLRAFTKIGSEPLSVGAELDFGNWVVVVSVDVLLLPEGWQEASSSRAVSGSKRLFMAEGF